MYTRFREWLYRFMQGRYGNDNLNNFLYVVYFVVFLISLFVNSIIIALVETVLIVVVFYRMLSRNIYKRQGENQKYLEISKKPKEFFKLTKNKFRDRKTHVYKTCPACKSNLRLPKVKGKHTAVCPRCGRRFDITI